MADTSANVRGDVAGGGDRAAARNHFHGNRTGGPRHPERAGRRRRGPAARHHAAQSITDWRWPDANEWLALGVASVLFYLGVAYTYDAYRGSDLSVVAPFRYWYLLVAIVTGYVGFGEVPGLHSILGMIIIVGAGAVVLWHQYGTQKG